MVQGFASKVKEKKRRKEEEKEKRELGFQVVLGLYWVSFQSVLWFGLMLRNLCIKEM